MLLLLSPLQETRARHVILTARGCYHVATSTCSYVHDPSFMAHVTKNPSASPAASPSASPPASPSALPWGSPSASSSGGAIDRALYTNYLKAMPHNCKAWAKYADLERSVGETEVIVVSAIVKHIRFSFKIHLKYLLDAQILLCF